MKASCIIDYIGHDGGGMYVAFYSDEDGNSGYGDNPKAAHWYGSPQECYAIKKGNVIPDGLVFWEVR